MKERDIHSIIRLYPYLLDPELENARLRYERVYDDGRRADFVFYLAALNRIIVVEVKRGIIDNDSLNQILGYIHKEEQENPMSVVIGYLVGKALSPTVKERLSRDFKGKIEFKAIEFDIPLKVKICKRCRKANNLRNKTCKWCGSREFIRID